MTLAKRKETFCPWCAGPLQPAEIDGRQRLVCTDRSGCGFVLWGNPTPVVAALVQRRGQVVLVRNRGWPEKMLGLVAGFLEAGETPEQGALREVQEELGLHGEIAGYIGHYSFLQMNQLILAFHVRAEGEIVLGEELVAYKEVAPDKVRPWPLGTGPAVRDWLAAQGIKPGGA